MCSKVCRNQQNKILPTFIDGSRYHKLVRLLQNNSSLFLTSQTACTAYSELAVYMCFVFGIFSCFCLQLRYEKSNSHLNIVPSESDSNISANDILTCNNYDKSNPVFKSLRLPWSFHLLLGFLISCSPRCGY